MNSSWQNAPLQIAFKFISTITLCTNPLFFGKFLAIGIYFSAYSIIFKIRSGSTLYACLSFPLATKWVLWEVRCTWFYIFKEALTIWNIISYITSVTLSWFLTKGGTVRIYSFTYTIFIKITTACASHTFLIYPLRA